MGKRGISDSAGRKRAQEQRLIDLTGQRFAKLVVTELAGFDASRNAWWKCSCDCGRNDVIALGLQLRKGKIKCCGCLSRAEKHVPLTAERLRKLLTYDPKTGLFHWKLMRKGLSEKRGTEAGGSRNTYVYICVDYKSYGAHRLAWLYMTDEWPTKIIDHINGNRSDNKWINLRQATPSQNIANSGMRTNSTSGYKGVSYHRRAKKWVAQIGYEGQNLYLGVYDTPEQAAEVRRKKATLLYGEFAKH